MAEPQLVEVAGDRALRLADRHAVVVEHDEELTLQGARVVQPFHRHAVDDGRVPDQRDHLPVALTVQRVAAGDADGRRDAGPRVPDAEQVVVALARLGKAGHAVALAQLVQQRQASGEQLVRVALVPDVEQQPVVAEVEDVVQRERQLDDAQVRGQVAARAGDLVADRVADFLSELFELLDRHPPEIRGSGEVL